VEGNPDFWRQTQRNAAVAVAAEAMLRKSEKG
jgi:hypothetical protein